MSGQLHAGTMVTVGRDFTSGGLSGIWSHSGYCGEETNLCPICI